jgi:hypothetical protein
MHGFAKQFAEGVFDPESVQILTDAFDDAWAKLQANKAPYADDDYALTGRTILAKYIISAAKMGERDRQRLAEGALLHIARQKLSRTPPKSG